MTNKYKFFVANWKMYGELRSINTINKVIKISKLRKFRKSRIVYCPPYTLLSDFIKKVKKTKIDVGAQNCHESDLFGPYTGFVNSKMIKNLGCKYVIIGHSENRFAGEKNKLINKKIKSALKCGLKVFLCIGETINQKRKNKTNKILSSQIIQSLKNVKHFKNIIIAYEPVWSIGTGIIPNIKDLKKNIIFIKKLIKKKYKINNCKIIYGGSVGPTNISNLNKLSEIDGYLIGGASQNSKKFIDIIKKTFN